MRAGEKGTEAVFTCLSFNSVRVVMVCICLGRCEEGCVYVSVLCV